MKKKTRIIATILTIGLGLSSSADTISANFVKYDQAGTSGNRFSEKNKKFGWFALCLNDQKIVKTLRKVADTQKITHGDFSLLFISGTT